jgi:hypothetical protein
MADIALLPPATVRACKARRLGQCAVRDVCFACCHIKVSHARGLLSTSAPQAQDLHDRCNHAIDKLGARHIACRKRRYPLEKRTVCSNSPLTHVVECTSKHAHPRHCVTTAHIVSRPTHQPPHPTFTCFQKEPHISAPHNRVRVWHIAPLYCGDKSGPCGSPHMRTHPHTLRMQFFELQWPPN